MTYKWEERASRYPGEKFYRDEARRITVCLESPRYHEKGLPIRSDTWIYYRDTHGFREGEFASAEAAMHAANVNPQSPSPKVVP